MNMPTLCVLGWMRTRRGGDRRPALDFLPAFVRQYRRRHGLVLGPDRNVVLTILQLDHHAGGEDVLALVVELDALVTHDQLIPLEIGGLPHRLALGRVGLAGTLGLLP